MNQAFVNLNGVRTKVVTYGRWIEESPKSVQPEDIIIVIPGNPGVTRFYKVFMETLYEKTKIPVWIVGHAGHEVPKYNAVEPIKKLKGNEKLFGLQGQVEHKRDFIRKYVTGNARIHLIGHSIGSYCILELLKDTSFSSRVIDVNLLFPTVEYMADTPNGKFMTRLVKPIVWLIVFLSWIFTYLPSTLQYFLVYCYMWIASMPKWHLKTIVDFIKPSVLEKVFFMAFEELDFVHERQNTIIKTNKNKIKFFYGKRDGWAPLSYCDQLKKDIPGVNTEISDFNHAFVLQQSKEVGDVVGDWLSNK